MMSEILDMVEVNKSAVYLTRLRHPNGRAEIAWAAADLCHSLFGDELPSEMKDSLFMLQNLRRGDVKVDVLKVEEWHALRTAHDLAHVILKHRLWDDAKASKFIEAGKGELNVEHQTITACTLLEDEQAKKLYLFKNSDDYGVISTSMLDCV